MQQMHLAVVVAKARKHIMHLKRNYKCKSHIDIMILMTSYCKRYESYSQIISKYASECKLKVFNQKGLHQLIWQFWLSCNPIDAYC